MLKPLVVFSFNLFFSAVIFKSIALDEMLLIEGILELFLHKHGTTISLPTISKMKQLHSDTICRT